MQLTCDILLQELKQNVKAMRGEVAAIEVSVDSV